MKRTALILSVLLGAFFSPAFAQYLGQMQQNVPAVPFQIQGPSCNLPPSVVNSEFQMLDAPVKVQNCMVTPANGYQRGAIGAHTQVDMNGRGGKAWTVYYSSECYGTPGVGQVGECGPLYTRDEAPEGSGPMWHSAAHFEFRNRSQNFGLASGANIELRDHYQEKYGTPSQGQFYGIIVQPYPNIRNVRGLRFMHGHTYEYTIDHDGAFEMLGNVDGTPFCRKFEPSTQQVLFIRGCHLHGAQVAHVIDLNWRQDLPLYIPHKRY